VIQLLVSITLLFDQNPPKQPWCLQVPDSVLPGKHQLVVEGLVEGRNAIFRNSTEVFFSTKYVSLFIQTHLPVYYPPQKGEGKTND
jgi:hypothetical protein